ncbi:von Willebrand factor A domain-containing protein 5A-like [Brienomyrus brachyistius]|uniref:von Willebrand factor A domain-containing protein 5A-like n=1 Tax=Brienomyrus brachyistius TaxID=42636 RepID=UPI0020B1A1DF|nr:von Willebrand factor A domain-containing protein 5A-like [Brienomyrus brachyistius]XP_048836960.1 von Willebrand factor A domain-containing protein 5A-like [Brienomyrus brachyistius]
MANACGLRTVNNEPVPLKSVEVQVDVQGHVASVSSTLQYENQESSPVEAVFIFPMESNVSIYSFVARIGDVEIKAQVKEKEQAQEEYDDAVSSGQQAFLLEESDESSDVFRLSVGSLPPGQSASVTLSYVTELAVQADDALRFCLPAVLNPRYTPAGSKSLTAEGSGPQGESVPYTLSLGVHMYSPSTVQSVQSNCPLTPLEFLSQDNTEAKVSLSPGHKFDRDVELLLYYGQPHQPTAILEAGQPSAQAGSLMGDTVAMLSFYPEIPSIPSSQMTSKGEFIFVVDRSGSMDCPMNQRNYKQTRISSARDTLLLLLKSLPVGCYFNIYGFGSSFESYFPESVEYMQANMETAVQKVKSMQADMGGTGILQVLQKIYSKPCLPSHPRQLFVFTDGEVGNTKEVIDLVKRHALSHRCFTFGIGEGASSALVNGMAEGGSGHPQFITGAERLQPKVMQSLRFAMQPVVEDISVKWNIPADISVTPLSPLPNVLFQNQRAILYFQLTGQRSGNISGSVSLHYTLDKKVVENTLTLNMKPKEDSSMLIHRLGARKAILALEERGKVGKKTKKKRAVKLSIQSGVSSSYTAFIAVNTENKQPIKGPLLCRNIKSMMFSPPPGCSLSLPPSGCSLSLPPSGCSLSLPPSEPMMFSALQGRMMAFGGPGSRYSAGSECMYPPLSGGSSWCSLEFGALKHGFRRRSAPMPPPPMSGGGGLRKAKSKCQAFLSRTMARMKRKGASPMAPAPEQETKDPLLQLISLQKVDGSWDLQPSLASIFGRREEEVATALPGKPKLLPVWATVLAVLWLHGHKMDFKDEWQFVAAKAVAWIKAQSGADLTGFVAAGNSFLGLQVELQNFGLQ